MIMTSQTIEELSSVELLTILKERVAVFVVEQNCPYQEVDQADFQARHISIWHEEQSLLAYARIIDQGQTVTFGRVLVTKDYRGQQLGRQLVTAVLAEIKQYFPEKKIEISAQTYLLDFYQSFGFRKTSEPYLEDNIEHIDMVLTHSKSEN